MNKIITGLDFSLFKACLTNKIADAPIAYAENGLLKIYDAGYSDVQMISLEDMLDKWENPVVNITGLDVEVVLGALKTDTASIVADTDKTVKLSLGWDTIAGDFELLVYEKTDGDYGNAPANVEHLGDLKEYSVGNGGSVLVEL